MREGVDLSGLSASFGTTGSSIVIIDKQGQMVIYGFKGLLEEFDPSGSRTKHY